MPPFLRFLIRRLLFVPLSMLVTTMLLYGFVMLSPPESRAMLYMSPAYGRAIDQSRLSPEQYNKILETFITRYHLNAPYPVQYAYWVFNLLEGNWGYSPVLRETVLSAVARRAPVTIQLLFFSMLVFTPLGMISGVISGSHHNQLVDTRFRLAAFVATSLPPFIVALVLMAVFYVSLHWLAPGQLSIPLDVYVRSKDFHLYTGFLIVDGLLNQRPDISLEAAKHLIMPVFTLSLLQWATLGRVTRASMIDEMKKEYVIAAQARGISTRKVIWRHAFRNTLTPSLSSAALSAATLYTNVFIVEVIYDFKGVSDLVLKSLNDTPDMSSLMGFAVFSVVFVLMVMLVLDISQAIFDPRVREGLNNQ